MLFIEFVLLCFLGMLGLNLAVYLHLRNKVSTMSSFINRVNVCDVCFALCGVLSVFWMFLAFWLDNSSMLCFYLSTVGFILLISFMQYKISRSDRSYQSWWQNITVGGKIWLAIVLLLFIFSVSVNMYQNNYLAIFKIVVFWFYLFVSWQIAYRHKIFAINKKRPLFVKFVMMVMFLFSKIFYYIAYFMAILLLVFVLFNQSRLSDPLDMDGCVDMGICKEGLRFSGCENEDDCLVSKENCLKGNYVWNEEYKTCNYRKKNEEPEDTSEEFRKWMKNKIYGD